VPYSVIIIFVYKGLFFNSQFANHYRAITAIMPYHHRKLAGISPFASRNTRSSFNFAFSFHSTITIFLFKNVLIAHASFCITLPGISSVYQL